MKVLYALCMVALLTSCATSSSIMTIPANQSVEIDYPGYDVYEVTLKNKSRRGMDVAVISKSTDDQVRGFGLGIKSKAEVMVESESKLVIQNNGNSDLKVSIDISEKNRSVFIQKGTYINFTLENTTDKSIPLLIPTVMNPNLSPNSRSGVSLKVGQEILFRSGGKKYILLTVDENIQKGDVLDVAHILKNRKKALGLT